MSSTSPGAQSRARPTRFSPAPTLAIGPTWAAGLWPRMERRTLPMWLVQTRPCFIGLYYCREPAAGPFSALQRLGVTAFRHFSWLRVPPGTPDNSPPFQRWVPMRPGDPVPLGTAECQHIVDCPLERSGRDSGHNLDGGGGEKQRRWHGGWAFMFACTVFCFPGRSRLATGGLYYVWRDKGCLTADRGAGLSMNVARTDTSRRRRGIWPWRCSVSRFTFLLSVPCCLL